MRRIGYFHIFVAQSEERGTLVKIINYEEKYRRDVQTICIETGSKDNLVNPEHYNFTLWMYCDPYLDHGKNFLLMDDAGKVQGYVLCAEDAGMFEKDMQPYFQKIKEKAPSFAGRCDLREYMQFAKDYPAHLHIDIREGYTGGGNGTALMHALLDALQKDHVKGVMLGVDKRNLRALGFYKKMGFQVLSSDQYGSVMGRKL
jgi:ribosomal protein S18 acetylase RimI-like enzyme